VNRRSSRMLHCSRRLYGAQGCLDRGGGKAKTEGAFSGNGSVSAAVRYVRLLVRGSASIHPALDRGGMFG
jgi:hypothetical protein